MKTVCGILQQVHLMMQRREGSPTDPLQCFKAGLLRRSLVFLKGAYVSIHVTQNVPWRLVVAMCVVSSCGHWEPGGTHTVAHAPVLLSCLLSCSYPGPRTIISHLDAGRSLLTDLLLPPLPLQPLSSQQPKRSCKI